RHIPIQVISGSESPGRAFRMGAFSFLHKPVEREDLAESAIRIKAFLDRQKKNLLIVEDSEEERLSLLELLSGDDVDTRAVGTAVEALELLKTKPFDCLILDLRLPDMRGAALIEKIKSEIGLLALPIIVHTGKDLSPEEELRLAEVTSAIVVKDATSPE